MRLVTRRTGLSAARLRMWERRYHVVEPSRSAGGQRLYSDDDIARLTLLAQAADAGHALPRIALLSEPELRSLLAEDHSPADTTAEPDEALQTRLVACVERLDAEGLERALRRVAMTHGAATFAEQVLAPLLERIGDRWHDGQLSPAHEHVASAVIGRVVGWVASQFSAGEHAPALVVATPQGEQHQLGAAVAGATAAEAGWRVIYLGADLPAADIAQAARQSAARAVALSLVNVGHARTLELEVGKLAARLSDAGVALAVGGSAASRMRALPAGVTRCATLAELRTFLASCAHGRL